MAICNFLNCEGIYDCKKCRNIRVCKVVAKKKRKKKKGKGKEKEKCFHGMSQRIE